MFTATLFDFNGVLVDDEKVHCQAICDALAPLGLSITVDEYWERYLGYDDVGAFRAILKDRGRSPSDAQVHELVEAKKPLYLARARAHLPLWNGAAELVKARAAAGPAAIVSGALRDEIELGLEVLGVRDLIGSITSAEDTIASKPDPDGYLQGWAWLQQQGVTDLRSVLVFEDSRDGIAAAKAAGLTCVAVAQSYPVELLERETAANLVLPSVAAVTEGTLNALWQKLHG